MRGSDGQDVQHVVDRVMVVSVIGNVDGSDCWCRPSLVVLKVGGGLLFIRGFAMSSLEFALRFDKEG